MSSLENKMFKAIAGRLTNDGLQKAVSTAVEGLPLTNLHQELKTVSQCIEQANCLISSPDNIKRDFAGITNTQRILDQHGLSQIPNPFVSTDNPRPWLRSLIQTIKVGNTEVGTVYKSPEKINEGDPLSVFRWYLYDGVGRMVAIHLGISENDKEQEKAGDWIGCAITEAAVALAEKGDLNAKSVVSNMLGMGFIASGWLLTNQLVDRARVLKV